MRQGGEAVGDVRPLVTTKPGVDPISVEARPMLRGSPDDHQGGGRHLMSPATDQA